jgi:hypothetical protein
VTLLIALSLVIGGFVVGFIVIYVVRRSSGQVKSAKPVAPKDMQQTPCPWCGNKEYSAKNPSFTCPKCGTMHHQSCWEEYGGCTTWECPLAPAGDTIKDTG